ncbi:AAA family ATPase [Thermaurantiacus tibetensis]|uniref:bifunctional aminoglycoside phosphotransferase/ATP-binding protein n=1 Tax=Thermaurantiacus tibetensis TaxID=2759035 RepID=UPI001890B3CA|nr:bifunctional aminoglycoside phosphotransferase/ATP-binding protein [Thermaurantiacus tibetensis]
MVPAPAPEPDALAWFAAGGPFGGTVPRRIDTHAASVFLAGDRAWKLKKPVSLGYLDFSTPERRRAALAAELALNRRTAPDVYLGLHPVVLGPEGLRLGTAGEGGSAIDWALEMRRFPDGAVLAERAQPLAPAEALALADAIAAFQGSLAPLPSDSAGALAPVLEGNRRSLETEAAILGPAAVEQFLATEVRAFARLRPRLGARRPVRGHGDLHLGNIAMVGGQPILFDALEFDEELATGDVAYDLAFLLMDLWARGLRDEANLVMNRWMDLTADEAAGPLLPFLMAVRASIRAHVTATRARQTGDSAAAAEARRLLALATGLNAPVPPRLVAIGGLSGTGKSSVARLLAAGLGAPPGARHLRSDVIRKRLHGVPPETRLPPSAYGPGSWPPVRAEMHRLAKLALEGGQAVLLDAVHADPADRKAAALLAAAAGVRFDGLWLEAPLAVRLARVGSRVGDASDADARVAEAQEAIDPGPPAPFVAIDASGPLAAVVSRAQALLELDGSPPPGSAGSRPPR